MKLDFSPTQKRIGRHLLFWAAIILVYYSIEATRGKPELFWFSLVRQLPGDIVTTYFTYYVIVKRYLLSKHYWTAALLLVVSGVIFSLLEWTVFYYAIIPVVYPEMPERPWLFGPGIIQVAIGMYYVAFMFTGLKLYRIWQSNKVIQQDLEKQHLKSELALLRAQINPHFLFNTLNNIDTLVFEDQHKASESIVKLSNIMRYMLNDANNAEQVPLEKEINCLQNFIDLHRLRLKEPDFIEFNITGDPRAHLIPAMLFLPFVENTFKHGSMQGPSPGIHIHIHIDDSSYFLEVSNRLRKNTAPYEIPSGVGLQNVRRRLDLIYGDEYQLEVSSSEGQYRVKLVLPQEIRKFPDLLSSKPAVPEPGKSLLVPEYSGRPTADSLR